MRLAVATMVLALAVASRAEPPPPSYYDVLYDVRLVPTEGGARVSLHVTGKASLVHAIRLRITPDRHSQFGGDGEIAISEDVVAWRPPSTGGALHYTFRIDHLRNKRSYDARIASDWALFRGDDLVPPAAVETEDGANAHARARLRVRLPEGWSLALPYRRRTDGTFTVEHAHRRFDRPTGWFVAGRLGILRETIEGVRIAIAGPAGHDVRRNDMLALLRWTMPQFRKLLSELPARLLIVGAGDPMWRGGLSGPASVYLHADRPLITPDTTSPLLHELMHAMLGIRGGPGADWIIEGLAELYSLEVLRRSRTVSRRRFARALERMERRGRRAKRLEAERARGNVTARAVGVLRALDRDIRRASEGRASLDDVVRALARERGIVTRKRLHELAEKVAGRSLPSLPR